MSQYYNNGLSNKSRPKPGSTEGERYGHPILDAAVKAMRAVTGGGATTKKAQKGYAKRQKNRIDKKVKEAGG